MLPTVGQALQNPAAFRAVNLLASLTGSLQVRAYRDGQEIDTPRFVERPNPFETGRDFYRDTATSLLGWGEFVWYVAARGAEGEPQALLNVPPWEMDLEVTRKPYARTWRWNGEDVASRDVVHGVYWREPGQLRGIGPLQKCQVAVAVAVEAELWAEKFFSGGPPLVVLQYADSLDEGEADAILRQWEENAGKPVRVLDQSAKAEKLDADPLNAQLVESRMYADTTFARMFGIPAPLLEAGVSGTSLTYRTMPDAMRQLIDMSLDPTVLSPIEDAMADLLPRSTTVRFDRNGLLRATNEVGIDVTAVGPNNAYVGALPGVR
jgi:HK97 family phage portal protein